MLTPRENPLLARQQNMHTLAHATSLPGEPHSDCFVKVLYSASMKVPTKPIEYYEDRCLRAQYCEVYIECDMKTGVKSGE